MTTTDSPELEAAWKAAALAEVPPAERIETFKEQFLILITCRDESHQVDQLTGLTAEGLPCKALLS